MSPGEEGGGECEIRDRSHTQQINGISIVRMRRLGVERAGAKARGRMGG